MGVDLYAGCLRCKLMKPVGKNGGFWGGLEASTDFVLEHLSCGDWEPAFEDPADVAKRQRGEIERPGVELGGLRRAALVLFDENDAIELEDHGWRDVDDDD